MIKSFARFVFLCSVLFVLGSCSMTAYVSKSEESGIRVLRVGVTADYPPMIFKQGRKIAGVEADLAWLLAQGLNKNIEFVELRWEQLIPALMENRIDIIMSGMSVTDARKVRIDFSDYYLKSGLLTLMRAEDSSKYNSVDSIKESFSIVGIVKDTTGEAFVRRTFPKATRIIALSKANDAPDELKNRYIDLFIHDASSIVWLASENEAELKGFWKPLNEEYLAWGIRKGNQKLLSQVNAVLKKWKEDGTLNKVLSKWLPYLKNYN